MTSRKKTTSLKTTTTSEKITISKKTTSSKQTTTSQNATSKKSMTTNDWFDEESVDDGIGDELSGIFFDSDVSDADFEMSDHDSDTEESGDSDDEINLNESNRNNYYLGKNKTSRWMKKPYSHNKTTNSVHVAKVNKQAEKCKTPMDCWELFFNKQVIEDIVKFTNIKLQSEQSQFQRNRDCALTDVTEIRALLGLLYLAGSLKMSRVNLRDIWATDGTSPDYFRCVMSYNRFSLLLCAIRFDDINTRKDRASIDKFAPIRDIWEHFNLVCQESYTPGQVLTIDEMMSAFRGRCSFKQYMPKKPDKYGSKTYALVDSKSFYVSKMEMYLGKQRNKIDNKPANVVKRISESVLNTGRTIVMDNWFTSIPLIEELKNDYNTTVVGTIRKNKSEIPPEFVNTKTKAVHSSLFGFQRDFMLVSYIPRKNKNVLLCSSLHTEGIIDANTGDRQKPQIITYYNKHKGGVDTVDKLKSAYSVSRNSNRWPLTAFFTLMNIATINSQIIYCANTKNKMKRSAFIKVIARELTEPLLKRRSEMPTSPIDLRSRIKYYSDRIFSNEISQEVPDICYSCPRRKNRKSKTQCVECHKTICREHTKAICIKCRDIDDGFSEE